MNDLLRLRPSLLLLCLLGLSSCDGSTALEQLFAPDANTDQWSQTEPSSQELPTDLRYPQATLMNSTPLAAEPTPRIQSRWQVAAPSQPIVQFYIQQFQRSDWELLDQQQQGQQVILVGQGPTLAVRVLIPTTNGQETEFVVEYGPIAPVLAPEEAADDVPQLADLPPQEFKDIANVPMALRPAVEDLAGLGVLGTGESNDALQPNEAIDRSTFVRWLVTTHNYFYGDRPSRQIRLGTENDAPLFQDVPKTHPDFAYIQGLAMAGFLPSSLTGEQTNLFRPDAPLTRETLLQWKVPLDMQKNLTTTSIDRIEQTWGFKDSNRINPSALSAVAADYGNGDLSNIRRVFGQTLILQPQKTVTRAEAAAALWFLGNPSEGLSAQDVARRRDPS